MVPPLKKTTKRPVVLRTWAWWVWNHHVERGTMLAENVPGTLRAPLWAAVEVLLGSVLPIPLQIPSPTPAWATWTVLMTVTTRTPHTYTQTHVHVHNTGTHMVSGNCQDGK